MKKFSMCVVFLALSVFCVPAQSFNEYLKAQCKEVGVPVNVAYAILLQENPELRPDAVHYNLNGSKDVGMFQLNSYYLYTDFIPRYWRLSEEFKWDNPFHSAYIAVRHIKWLWSLCTVGTPESSKIFTVALAYNCGRSALESGKVPAQSVSYAVRVVESFGRGF
jgi:hypothetical protein